MASGLPVNDVGGPFRRIFGDGTVSGMDEGELLRRFATRRDPSALEALVVRHGPMVLGVCRRVLISRDASEDAFQATFLVLAKKAGSIRDPDRLGPWLHGVAHRVALRSRADRARRHARERTGTEEPAMATTPVASESESDFDRIELKATLDEEVRRLPAKFRDPIVLCYLDGLTHDEAAEHLACPVGTVRSRLATARDKLRDRLSRRGVTVPAGVFAGVLTAESASAAVSPVLLLSTVRASTAFASGMAGATLAGLVPAGVATLAEGVSTTMIVSKLKVIGALMMMGVLTLGVGGATAQRLNGPAEVEEDPKPPAQKPEEQVAKLTDLANRAEARAKLLEAEVKSLKEAMQATTPAGPDAIAILQARRDGKAAELQKAEAQKRVAANTLHNTQKLFETQAISEREVQKYQADLEIAEAQLLARKAELDEADILLNRAKRRPEADQPRESKSTTTSTAVSGQNMSNSLGGGTIGTTYAIGINSGQSGGLPTAGMMGGGRPGSTTLFVQGTTGSKTATGNDPDLHTYQTDQFVIVHKSKSNKVDAFSNETGAWTSYQVPKGTDVVPLFTANLVALNYKGDEISQVATYVPAFGQWHPIDLAEAGKGEVTPNLSPGLVIYTVGKHAYGFSLTWQTWSVQELADSSKPSVITTANSATVQQGDHVYIFSAKTGKWTTPDARPETYEVK